MIGFHANLSMQDSVLQLKAGILDPGYGAGMRAVLGLGLNKAFNNVSHKAIMSNLSVINPGERVFRYIRSFLSDRAAELEVGKIKSDPIPLSGRSTPQGSILSPFLFNLSLINFPPNSLPNRGYSTLYADITLWVTTKNDVQVESTLQQAVDVI